MKPGDSIPLEPAAVIAGTTTRATPHELFEAHFDDIYRYFSRRVSGTEEAKDLTAETFAAVVESGCPRNVEPLCWLYGIARRKLATALRKRKVREVPIPKDLVQPETTEHVDAGDLRKLIDRLPNDQREALLLQALEDLSVAQIGKVMGKSQGSVKALLQRAKERVRQQSRFIPEVN